MEILYDIDIQAQAAAKNLGIRLERPLALNDDPLFIGTLANVNRKKAIDMDWLNT